MAERPPLQIAVIRKDAPEGTKPMMVYPVDAKEILAGGGYQLFEPDRQVERILAKEIREQELERRQPAEQGERPGVPNQGKRPARDPRGR